MAVLFPAQRLGRAPVEEPYGMAFEVCRLAVGGLRGLQHEKRPVAGEARRLDLPGRGDLEPPAAGLDPRRFGLRPRTFESPCCPRVSWLEGGENLGPPSVAPGAGGLFRVPRGRTRPPCTWPTIAGLCRSRDDRRGP